MNGWRRTVRVLRVVVLSAAIAAGAGCAPDEEATLDESARELEGELAVPAAPGSGEPFLARSESGELLLTWIEPAETGSAVRFARLDGARWSGPFTVVARDDLFVNWADFPSVAAMADGTLAVHWLQKTAASTYAYEVRIARSADQGRTWSEGVVPHDDGTPTEHGFVSLQPAGAEGELHAVWLDGRNMTQGHHGEDGGEDGGPMTLRWARLSGTGAVLDQAEIDDRTCECCQTGMAMTPDGPLVVYRDRSSDEVRDIASVRRVGSSWSEPQLVHSDGWRIEGCPVNGPRVDAEGTAAAVAWYTGAEERGRVLVAFSDDSGASWNEPVQVDEGSPVGRVDVLLLDPGRAVVTWIERRDDGAEVLTRVVGADGAKGSARRAGITTAARAAGFPRTVRVGERVYFGWNEPGEASRIRVSWMRIE